MEVSDLLILDESKSTQDKTSAARVMPPLLDALNWQGDRNRVLEALTEPESLMTTEGLIEAMANLQFKYEMVQRVKGKDIGPDILPVLIVNDNHHFLILNISEKEILVFDGQDGAYKSMQSKDIHGDLYLFQYADDLSTTLVRQQKNWFSKMMLRFKGSIKIIVLISFLMTCLDLLIPVLIVLVYDQLASQESTRALIITYAGVILYLSSSYFLGYYRAKLLNYVSTRMGVIISSQTYTRLLYLSPSYTETASINSQINRIKDFENLKRFITSDLFVDLLELLFSIVYVIAIFVLAGWIGFIPIITFVVVTCLGLIMNPFHRVKMERTSDASGKRQQKLIEILKNSEEIKAIGLSDEWIERYKDVSTESILSSYELSDYVNTSKSISYFITNASVLAVVYFGILRIMNGDMTMGVLIGVIMLYWKVLSSIRGSFTLSVQISSLSRSIAQINRFMNLPQDTNFKSNMIATRKIKGFVRFKDVSMVYSKKTSPVISKLSFETAPGTILGITGHDGAGKTTILKMILGMYIPQAGRIFIDNSNIKQLEPLSLRKSIGYAPQKDILFSGTIRENFTIFNAQISDAQIENISELTGLSNYMKSLDYTLDTLLTEKEISKASLSLKKLFSITRAFCRGVNLFLLDEPENYLREDEIQKIIELIMDRAKMESASVIISTKNAEILSICDEVIRLNQGRRVRR